MLNDRKSLNDHSFSVTIRRAKMNDIMYIFRIELLSFKDPYPIELLKSLMIMSQDMFLVAEINGNLIGYVVSLIRRGYICHILSIAVHPNYRRRGIATKLMVSIEKEAKKHNAFLMRLEVRASNCAAINLYKKLGFSESYIIPKYYRDGESAIVMFKLLK